MKHMSFHYELRISNNMAKTKLHICPYAYVYIDKEFNISFISLVQITDYDNNSNWQLHCGYDKRDKTCIFFC